MSFFWLIIALIALYLVVSSERKKSKNVVDRTSASYRQGYNDGYNYSQYKQHQSLNSCENEAKETALSEDKNKVSTESYVSEAVGNKPQSVADYSNKAKSKQQNINISLYIASILLVGGVSLFSQTIGISDSTKYLLIWLMVLAYYFTGLTLLKKIAILKPAAVAFVGTSLAALPFTGLLLNSWLGISPSFCWFITSLIACFAYIHSTIKLKSQILAYITVASFISLASSSLATLSAGVLWYLIALITLGALFTIIAKLGFKSVPEVFHKPIMKSGQWLVPSALFASVLTISSLTRADYVLILLTSSVFYIANALTFKRGSNERTVSWLLARLLTSLAIVIYTYELSRSWTAVAHSLFTVGVVQFIISVVLLPKNICSKSNQNEFWVWIAGAMMIIANLFLFDNSNWAAISCGYFTALGIISVAASLWLKRVELNLFTLFSLLSLPILVCRDLFSPAFDWGVVSIIYWLFAVLVFAARLVLKQRQLNLTSRFMLNFSLVMFSIFMLTTSIDSWVWWQLAVFISVALICYGISWVESEVKIIVLGNLFTFVSFFQLGRVLELSSGSVLSLVSWLSLLGFFGTAMMLKNNDKTGEAIYRIMWPTAVLGAGLTGLCLMLLPNDNGLVVSGSLTVLLTGLVIGAQDLFEKRLKYIDIAAVVTTTGLMRILSILAPDLHGLVYIHWWSITSAGLAYAYYRFGRKKYAKIRLILSLFILSFFTSGYALGGEAGFQILFLVEHAALIIAGLALSYRMLTIWGAVGVALSVLWMLKGFTSILLSLIGLVIIIAVIYVIIKSDKNKHESNNN